MRKLDRIQIENFKSIRSLDLELNNLNVFIGANGSGKSNFIGVFKFLNKLISRQLQDYVEVSGRADNFLYFGSKTSDYLSINLRFSGEENFYKCKLKPTKEEQFVFVEEKFQEEPWGNHLGMTNIGLKESILSSTLEEWRLNLSIPTFYLDDLQNWKIYHFEDTSDSARVRKTGDLHDNQEMRDDASNLAAYLYYLQKKHYPYFKNIEDTIKLVAPFFRGFDLHSQKLEPEKIKLEWKEVGSDKYFDATSLSDGTLRFICLVTLLMQPHPPSFIILDEPELGLHPAAITILASMLKSAAEKTQILVATQSVTLVNQFEPSNIIVVEREDKQSVFKHLKQEDLNSWLEDYRLGDLWEKNIFGGRP